MKKVLMIVTTIILFVGGALGIYFGVYKTNDVKLAVEMFDVRVEQGKTANIEYRCSIKEAIITFEIEDESYALLDYVVGIPVVRGLYIGRTKITLNATYKDQKTSCSADVEIIPTGSGGENEVGAFEITFTPIDNFACDGNTITIEGSMDSMFYFEIDGLSINEHILLSDNDEVEISRHPALASTYVIFCSQPGEYDLSFKINNSLIFDYELVVT